MSARPSMLAAVLTGARRFDLREVARPEPGPDQVRVRIEGCGVCGANLPCWQGRPWLSYPLLPGAPGHEAWGRVDAVGPGVLDVHPGERVAGLAAAGFAEQDLFDRAGLVPLPETLDLRDIPAEPLGCAASAFQRAHIRDGDTVAVIGIGFLGALLVRLAVDAGARVIAISRRAYSLEVADRLGAAHRLAWDPDRNGSGPRTTDEIVGQVLELTSGRGCPRVIEVVGNQAALDLATRLTSVRARLVIAGFHQDGPRQIDLYQWNWRGIDVINAHEREPAAHVAGMRSAISAIESDRLDPDSLYTDRVPLDRIDEAFEALEARRDGFLKALVIP